MNTILEAVSELETALKNLQSNFEVDYEFELPGAYPTFWCPVGLVEIGDALDAPVIVTHELRNEYTACVKYRGITFIKEFWVVNGEIKGIHDENLLSFLEMPGVIPNDL